MLSIKISKFLSIFYIDHLLETNLFSINIKLYINYYNSNTYIADTKKYGRKLINNTITLILCHKT